MNHGPVRQHENQDPTNQVPSTNTNILVPYSQCRHSMRYLKHISHNEIGGSGPYSTTPPSRRKLTSRAQTQGERCLGTPPKLPSLGCSEAYLFVCFGCWAPIAVPLSPKSIHVPGSLNSLVLAYLIASLLPGSSPKKPTPETLRPHSSSSFSSFFFCCCFFLLLL